MTDGACRLLALSMHREEVGTDVWERAKELDARRKARVLKA